MKKCVKAVLKTMKWTFIVFCLYVVLYAASLFFREERIPASLCNAVIKRFAPTNLVIRCDQVGIGFRRGINVRGLKIYDLGMKDATEPVAGADAVSVYPLSRFVRVERPTYKRLPDSYYQPGNQEKNARVEAEFPTLPPFTLVVVQPDILAARPERVETVVRVTRRRIDFDRMHLDWPDKSIRQGLDGHCYVDLNLQEVYGEIKGLATQAYIRPLVEALDVPVALPYMDGFTEVPEPVPSFCAWKVNLVNNDFDLWLDLHPLLGKYNAVPMKKADGKIHLHSYTRGTSLNYRTEVGPIDAVDDQQRRLSGSVGVTGTNGYNVVTVNADSSLPAADILRIGGFTGQYVNDDVVGDTVGKLEFRFPRAMTNNYEVLNGEGHVKITNGRLMRLKLFAGLTKLLADHVPGVSAIVDQSQASADYRIENGVVKSDNIFIEGDVFSIKMYGSFDATKDALDFTVRVQFIKNDSLMGKYFVHPVTWPFTKLLLEFRLTGSSSDPQWRYISVIDRVLNIIK